MANYIERLIAAGYSVHDAVSVVLKFWRKRDLDGLEKYIEIAEAHDVAGV